MTFARSCAAQPHSDQGMGQFNESNVKRDGTGKFAEKPPAPEASGVDLDAPEETLDEMGLSIDPRGRLVRDEPAPAGPPEGFAQWESRDGQRVADEAKELRSYLRENYPAASTVVVDADEDGLRVSSIEADDGTVLADRDRISEEDPDLDSEVSSIRSTPNEAAADRELPWSRERGAYVMDLREPEAETFAPDDASPEDFGLTSADESYTPRVGPCPGCGEIRSGQVAGGKFMPGSVCHRCDRLEGDLDGMSEPDEEGQVFRLALDQEGTVTRYTQDWDKVDRSVPDDPYWEDDVRQLADPDAVRDALRDADPDYQAVMEEISARQTAEMIEDIEAGRYEPGS